MSSEEYLKTLSGRKRKKTTSAVTASRAIHLCGGMEDLNNFDEGFEEIKADLKSKLGRNPSNLETMTLLLKLYKEEKKRSEAIKVKVEPDMYP